MATELQILNRLSKDLYVLFKGHEFLFNDYPGLGIQCAELLNSVNSIINIKGVSNEKNQ